ncbi:hypothetical protein [Nitrosopumilus sp.]|uniref:hypothetical protein n=1 Tax=Nitrosopumilus sp. TaxID=2024843 RepID=UPI0026306CD0|nr:hypothetical protein [Nitrosopumilus sp.]
MEEDFQDIEDISNDFQRYMAIKQMNLNQIRKKQFQSSMSKKPRERFENMMYEKKKFERKEISQISHIVEEVNRKISFNLKNIKKDEIFKKKEAIQKMIILNEIERKISTKEEITERKTFAQIVDLLTHVEILLETPALPPKQIEHLKKARTNILLGLNLTDTNP